MKSKFILLIILLVLWNTVSYAQYSSEKELISKIRSFKTDESLYDFLYKEGMIPVDSIYHFHTATLKVDVFRKNLFGSSDNEITIQLRDSAAYAVSFFYYAQGKFMKVPGHLYMYYYEGGAYYSQKFSFSYENIFQQNEYALLARYYSEYNRSAGEEYTLYKISPDQIKDVYYYSSVSSYSGLMLYNYSTSVRDSFVLVNHRYPKVLVLNKSFNNYDGDGSEYELHESSDGHTSEGTSIDSVFFTQDGAHKVRTTEEQRHVFYIGSMEYMDFLPVDACYTDTTIYITPGFARVYIKESELPFTIFTTDENGFVKCCNAYINEDFITVIAMNEKTNQRMKRSFELYPSVISIIKPDASLKNLYYDPEKNSIDSVDAGYYYGRVVRLSKDESYVYEVDPARSMIRIWNTMAEYEIPLALMEPYLKPDAVQLFRK